MSTTRRFRYLLAVLLLAGLTLRPGGPATAGDFDELVLEQRLADFRLEAVYENEAFRLIGARFRHVPSEFVLDVLRIQSLPQAFIWVNTPPVSDQGEPHTLEHLLLGKGTKGRGVASLEDMSLGSSSAFTQQVRTCYHFNASAGADVFFQLFEAKLDAMIHPNFTDEEIRREVCNMGVIEDPSTGALGLEEKGTVYNEMVSSFERPGRRLYRRLYQVIYGERHPLALNAGGFPAAIRSMTPEDLRRFHTATHHLNNLGAAVAIGDEIDLADCLERLSGILARVEPDAAPGDDPATQRDRLPAPAPAPAGEIHRVHFPHQNENEPGRLVFAWPAARELDANEAYLYELFMRLLASGSTSNLYGTFIDSQTRVMDIGASGVGGWVSSHLGRPAFISFSNVDPASLDEETIGTVRSVIRNEIKGIVGMRPDSARLTDFNQRAANLVTADRRYVRDFLNSPPRFGYRGTGATWIEHLEEVHERGGFRRNLANVEQFEYAEQLLTSGENVWRSRIAGWALLDVTPWSVATTADPDMIARDEAERGLRIAAFTAGLKSEYGVESEAEAIERYRQSYAAETGRIEVAAASIPMPPFVSDPPLTLDDPLRYAVTELPGDGQMVVSTFDNMTSATVGLAFRLDVVPESLLVYVPALPTLLTEVGVIKDGVPVAYDDFAEILRQEILDLDVGFDYEYDTERVELSLTGSGTELDETRRAIDWLGVTLFHPDLRPENLPRIRDAVDLRLSRVRNRMRGSEESWVDSPANCYWKQDNPLILSAASFLTQVHALHRLRWMLLAAGEAEEEFAGFMARITAASADLEREALSAVLTAMSSAGPEGIKQSAGGENADAGGLPLPQALLDAFGRLSAEGRRLVGEAARDLGQSLSDIPDATLRDDFRYLCAQMNADLAITPEATLTGIERVLRVVRHQDNVRGYMISNAEDRATVAPLVDAIVSRLDAAPSVRQTYARLRVIDARLAERQPLLQRPVHVALVNENTRSGVHIHRSDCADYRTRDPAALLDFLAARLYGGGGAHSMFMQTWGAGLAYSNGLRSDERLGRLTYYAERCPDLAQTMQFVVETLENAPHDSTLADYAVAQAFGQTRAGARYEQRGEAMAADLADGKTPDVVRGFRQGILDLRRREDLYQQLRSRMEGVYGEVLPGYGPSSTESARTGNTIYFVIGPEQQLQSWLDYLNRVEQEATLYRIYPRDYWLVRGVPTRVAGD